MHLMKVRLLVKKLETTAKQPRNLNQRTQIELLKKVILIGSENNHLYKKS